MRLLGRAGPIGLGIAISAASGAWASLSSAPRAFGASLKTAVPITSLKVCELFPATVVKLELASRLLPIASYSPSSSTTVNSYATCFYHFANSYYVNIEVYGPPGAKPLTHGARLPVLGTTGRHYVETPNVLVTAFVHGYDVTLVAPKSKVATARLAALGRYVLRNLP